MNTHRSLPVSRGVRIATLALAALSLSSANAATITWGGSSGDYANSHASTHRLCQSITAHRYAKPPRTGIYVMSVAQT